MAGDVTIQRRPTIDAHELDRLCSVLHTAYERASAATGWETQPETRVRWEHLPEANKETMRVAVSALLVELGLDTP